jgi:hypothetical protein
MQNPILTIHIFDDINLEIFELTDAMGESARNAIDSLLGSRGIVHASELSATDRIVIELAETLSKVKYVEYPPEEQFLTSGLDDVVHVAIRILKTQVSQWMNETANSGMLLGVVSNADLVIGEQRYPGGLFQITKRGDLLQIVKPHPAILEKMDVKFLTPDDFDDTAINLARQDNHQPHLPPRLGSNPDEQKLIWMNKLQSASRSFLRDTAILLQDYAEELVHLTYNQQLNQSNPRDPKAGTPAKSGKKSTAVAS